MALIPPLFVQGFPSVDSFANGNHNVVITYPSAVTKGNLLIASIGALVPEGPDTYTINSISDTLGSVWSRQFQSGFVTGVAPNRTFWTTAMWAAFATLSGADTVTINVSATGGFSKSQLPNVAEFKNVGGVDQGGFGSSSGNPLISGVATTTQNNSLAISQEWFIDGGISFGNAPVNTGCQWTVAISPGSPSRPLFYSNVGGSGTGIGITSITNNNLAPAFMSVSVFFPAAPTAVTNGNGFFEDYPRMTWMKNVAFLSRDYWDQGLSSPYVGQIWPAPNSGGAQSGQTYPF